MEQYKNLNFTAEQINQKLDSIGEGVINTVEQTPLKHILFSNTSSSLKTVINPNQQISVVEINSKITPVGDKLPTWDVYINHLLCINSVSCENKVCSHNYVELANGSDVDILSGDISTELSRKPVIQVLQQDQVKESNFARYEVVSKVSAPTYVTCQATGYKLISNKEQPSGDAYRIPWLLAYFPAATSASSPKENIAQHKPMYIRYDVTDNTIKVTAIQINGIWEVISDSTKYDFNNQIENLTTDKMTLNTSKEEDLTIYSPDNRDFYTLNL